MTNRSLERLLVEAAETRDIDRVREIIAAGADLRARLPDGFPITFVTTSHEIRLLMLDSGADVNSRCSDGTTLLHVESMFGPEEVQALISRGADVSACNDHVETPLFYATDGDQPEVIDLLVANGADVNWKSLDQGWTSLHAAAASGRPRAAEALLRNGADIEARDRLGITPLMVACYMDLKKSDIANVFLAHGADVNAASKEGARPLHYVASEGRDSLITRLLQAGADINAITCDGETPLDTAIRKQHSSTAQLLREKGATRGRTRPRGKGPCRTNERSDKNRFSSPNP